MSKSQSRQDYMPVAKPIRERDLFDYEAFYEAVGRYIDRTGKTRLQIQAESGIPAWVTFPSARHKRTSLQFIIMMANYCDLSIDKYVRS